MSKKLLIRRVKPKSNWTVQNTLGTVGIQILTETQARNYSKDIIVINDALGTSAQPASPVGVYTVKNFKLQICLPENNQGYDSYYVALMYIPKGVNIYGLNYIPGQAGAQCPMFLNADDIIASRYVQCSSADTTNITISSRLARKLHQGDSIKLIITHLNYSASASSGTGLAHYVCTYNLKYN